MPAHRAMQNKELFSPQSILVYDPKAGTCTIWTSEPSSYTGPASCLTDQEKSHLLVVQRDPENTEGSTLKQRISRTFRVNNILKYFM